ncbi:MAG TPA: cyclopropane-fatty-acyl-phospholipid synthase family protein [Candidatus Dormibacteraeota bacterium]|nr:cyclopropane-fatty-acyl-phospholipid synthase family protein [Candidatus Dormibacteraeota bacterium]
MIAEEFASPDPHARIAIAALRVLFADDYGREFGVALWDGTRVRAAEAERFVLRVTAPGALRVAFAPPLDLSPGRAFGAGLLDAEGDLVAAVDSFYRAIASRRARDFMRLARLLRLLPKLQRPRLREPRLRGRLHSQARDRAAIGFHYDQPVEFYRSFLGSKMVYSCAYFDDGIESLDDAQAAKLDYTLRKLRLRAGERMLDIGCGWGALVIRAAQLGAHALGITLSRLQYEEARRRVDAAGVGDLARIELRDYREMRGERFDKVVSVGMFEHVGRARFAEYFRAAYDALRPGGLFLNHAIANESGERRDGPVGGFLGRFVFPDGELVAVSNALAAAERVGFEVRDVESLREHYERTLRAWMGNLERNRAQAVAAAGETSYRSWRLYLAGSAQGFASRRIGVYQSLLARPHDDGRVELPLTRRDLYAQDGRSRRMENEETGARS